MSAFSKGFSATFGVLFALLAIVVICPAAMCTGLLWTSESTERMQVEEQQRRDNQSRAAAAKKEAAERAERQQAIAELEGRIAELQKQSAAVGAPGIDPATGRPAVPLTEEEIAARRAEIQAQIDPLEAEVESLRAK